MSTKRFIIEYELELIKAKQEEERKRRQLRAKSSTGKQRGGNVGGGGSNGRGRPALAAHEAAMPIEDMSDMPKRRVILSPLQARPGSGLPSRHDSPPGSSHGRHQVAGTTALRGTKHKGATHKLLDEWEVDRKVRELQHVTRSSTAHLQDMLQKFHEQPNFEKSPVVVPQAFVSDATKRDNLLRSSFKTSTTNLPMEKLLHDGPIERPTSATLDFETADPALKSFLSCTNGMKKDIELFKKDEHRPTLYQPNWNDRFVHGKTLSKPVRPQTSVVQQRKSAYLSKMEKYKVASKQYDMDGEFPESKMMFSASAPNFHDVLAAEDAYGAGRGASPPVPQKKLVGSASGPLFSKRHESPNASQGSSESPYLQYNKLIDLMKPKSPSPPPPHNRHGGSNSRTASPGAQRNASKPSSGAGSGAGSRPQSRHQGKVASPERQRAGSPPRAASPQSRPNVQQSGATSTRSTSPTLTMTPSKDSSVPVSPGMFFSPESDFSASPFGNYHEDYMSPAYAVDQDGFPIAEDPMSPNRQAWMHEKLHFVEKKWHEKVAQLHAVGQKIEQNNIYEVSIMREPPEIIVGITGYVAVLLGLKPNWKTIRGTLLKESTIFSNFVRDVRNIFNYLLCECFFNFRFP